MSKRISEQMGLGFTIYGYGCALGSMLAAAIAPLVAYGVTDALAFNWPEYAVAAIMLIQSSLIISFVVGATCGALLGRIVNPQHLFNDRPKLARLLGCLFIIIPLIPIALERVSASATFAICLSTAAVLWITIGTISLYFIDREPRIRSKFDG